MEKLTIKATKRAPGKNSELNNLRRSGKVPGIFYSAHDEPVSIFVTDKSLTPLVYTSDTHVVSLEIEDGGNFDCIIKDVQFDPLTDKIVHFDLFGLTTGETIQMDIPIQLVGTAQGVKDGGILQHVLHKVTVECLPKDIPSHIDLNVEGLKIGDSIHVKDLNLENVTILNLEDAVIVAVSVAKAPAAEAAETEEAEAPTEPELISKDQEEEE